MSSITFDDWGNRNQTSFASGAQDTWVADDATGTRLKTWMPSMETNGAPTGMTTNARGVATQMGTANHAKVLVGLGWDGLGQVNAVGWSGTIQSYRYAPSGLRVSLADSLNSTNDRRYAYTSGGLLLAEYNAPVPNGTASLQIPHRPDQFSGCAKYLGAFSAGDVVTAKVWFKAPNGVHGELFLGDAGGADPYDQCSYISGMGNGGWQQLTVSHVMTHADQMWVYLYSDQWSVADPTRVPAHAGTTYDDLLVTVNQTVVLSDGFEGAWPNTAPAVSLDPGPWASGVDGVAVLAAGSLVPLRREIIYLGSRAVAEVDATGVHELHCDHLGSPRLITKGVGPLAGNLVGTVEATQAFGVYGELIWRAGSYVPITGYTGHIQADASGLIYMRGRYYSPAWHRFVNGDQGADANQLNQMAYGGGRPMMGTDPSGMMMTVNGLIVDSFCGASQADLAELRRIWATAIVGATQAGLTPAVSGADPSRSWSAPLAGGGFAIVCGDFVLISDADGNITPISIVSINSASGSSVGTSLSSNGQILQGGTAIENTGQPLAWGQSLTVTSAMGQPNSTPQLGSGNNLGDLAGLSNLVAGATAGAISQIKTLKGTTVGNAAGVFNEVTGPIGDTINIVNYLNGNLSGAHCATNIAVDLGVLVVGCTVGAPVALTVGITYGAVDYFWGDKIWKKAH